MTATVYLATPRGIAPALLLDRTGGHPDRLWVRVRGKARAMRVDRHLVYATWSNAQEHWRQARAHQRRVQQAGARIRVIDALLSLALTQTQETYP